MGHKILHLTQFLGIGGLEKILLLLIKEQVQAGHHVELMVYDHEQSWVEYFRKEGIIVHSDFRKNEGYDLKLVQWLDQNVRSFDVVHTHDLNPLMYAAPLKLWSRLRDKRFPRLIHTAHGTEHAVRRPVTRLYERACSMMTDLTVAVGPGVKDFYVNDLLVAPFKVATIKNGTRVPATLVRKESAYCELKRKFGFRDGSPVWTNIARIVPLKQQHLLIEAARKRPEIELLLVGPSGDKEYWDRLQKDLPSNVHIPGGRSDIAEILEGSDFFISASAHEGIPVAALEAGALGLPCLLSMIPGHLTLQRNTDMKVAEYFDPAAPEDLPFIMREMEEQRGRSAEMARQLHFEIKQNYSSQKMYHEYLRAYEGAL